MIPTPVLEPLAKILKDHEGEEATIQHTRSLSGGCINDAARVETHRGQYFVKWNDATRYPAMFETEARGLELLAATGALRVPGVIGHGEATGEAFLVLEFIEGGRQAPDFWEAFGAGLAQMHRNRADQFGLDHDNYIGSLTQHNQYHQDWNSFFIEQRLEVQRELARSAGKAGRELDRQLQKLYNRLSDFFPEEPPALLHGDLWSGNYMTGGEGQAVIIDPAVYYGHRYMDIGMSRLFGGYSEAFYSAYLTHYPMEKEWQKGIEIANLYPLLVHVNLFGGGYLGSVMNVLNRF